MQVSPGPRDGPHADASASTRPPVEWLSSSVFNTVVLAASTGPISDTLHQRHFRRKHGTTAYYGQLHR